MIPQTQLNPGPSIARPMLINHKRHPGSQVLDGYHETARDGIFPKAASSPTQTEADAPLVLDGWKFGDGIWCPRAEGWRHGILPDALDKHGMRRRKGIQTDGNLAGYACWDRLQSVHIVCQTSSCGPAGRLGGWDPECIESVWCRDVVVCRGWFGDELGNSHVFSQNQNGSLEMVEAMGVAKKRAPGFREDCSCSSSTYGRVRMQDSNMYRGP